MNAPAASDSRPNASFALGALASLVALIVLSLLWELWLAPVRPGAWALALKALPLAYALPGVARRSVYTLQWASVRTCDAPRRSAQASTNAWVAVMGERAGKSGRA